MKLQTTSNNNETALFINIWNEFDDYLFWKNEKSMTGIIISLQDNENNNKNILISSKPTKSY